MPTKIYLTTPMAVLGRGGLLGETRLSGRQGRLTLAMLALEHRRPVLREELADELWPEGLPRSWEVSLKAIISKLRGVLRNIAPDLRLESSIGRYQLAVGPDTTIDVETALARIHGAEAALRRGEVEAAAGDGLVASMIAARPFLDDLDTPWTTRWRHRMTDVRLRALDLLSEVWLLRGEPAQAARDAAAILEIDPYREAAYRTMIRAQLALGDRAAAARTYASLAERLAADLGVEPAPETRRLVHG